MSDPRIKGRGDFVCDGHGWISSSKPCPTCMKRWNEKPWVAVGSAPTDTDS